MKVPKGSVAHMRDPVIRRLLGAYREGLNSLNPFYRFLCFWKVADGCDAARKARLSKEPSESKHKYSNNERMPNDIASPEFPNSDVDRLMIYKGEKFTKIQDKLRPVMRNAIAHLKPTLHIIDPDEFHDLNQCEREVPIVQYMARRLLTKELEFVNNG